MDLTYCAQEWAYREVFKISRGASEVSQLFVAYIRDGDIVGRGECALLPQYGHSREMALEAFEAARAVISEGARREDLPAAVANSSVRNALDCALWDLECKRAGQTIWSRAGVPKKPAVEVDLTISVNGREKMREDALRAVLQGYRILKLKADKTDVVDRVAAIAEAAPGVELIVDANEAWDIETLESVSGRLSDLGVTLIEQPLHHQDDSALTGFRGPIPICADESCRDLADLEVLAERYQAINIKLDKVGGLTPGLALARAAKARGLGLMLGCSGPTSLGAAPAYVIATLADHVDLDGPALLLEDRPFSMNYSEGRLACFSPELWG